MKYETITLLTGTERIVAELILENLNKEEANNPAHTGDLHNEEIANWYQAWPRLVGSKLSYGTLPSMVDHMIEQFDDNARDHLRKVYTAPNDKESIDALTAVAEEISSRMFYAAYSRPKQSK